MNATPLPAGSLRATSLNAGRRATELSTVSDQELDVLVVGGGVTGTGIALDAASRGLSVALVEAADLASGASRCSSKLIDGDLSHGGLAKLAHGDLGPARENAVERHTLMMRTAPHLVRTLPQLIPLSDDVSRRDEFLLSAGLRAEDALRLSARTPGSVLPSPRRIPRAEALALAPGVRANSLRGGLLSFAGQLLDDARLVVALARTAAGFGARILTRVSANALDRNGADLVDAHSGKHLRIRARSVVNAAGAWAPELVPQVRLHTFRESYLVIDADAAGVAGTALISPSRSGKPVMVLPQPDGHAYLGYAEGPVDGPITAVPPVPESDVDTLLEAASAVLDKPLERKHVIGSFSGLSPTLDTARSNLRSRVLARRRSEDTPTDSTWISPEGVITAAGGKLTTYRKTAARIVDAAIRTEGLATGPSRTAEIPLVGAATRTHLASIEAEARLLAKYGIEAPRITALTELDPDLAEQVAPSLTAAEVLWSVRHEGALNADDVLDRRSHVGLDAGERATARPAVVELVERALQGVLG